MTIVHKAEPCERNGAWLDFNERITVQLGVLLYDFRRKYPNQVRTDSSLNRHEKSTQIRRSGRS